MAGIQISAIRSALSVRPPVRDLSERRRHLDALASRFRLPDDVHVEVMRANGVAAEWTRTPNANEEHVVIFLHGGGYVSGSLSSHRHMVAEVGRAAAARTFSPDYRLAPEHPFPAALEDAMLGYRHLLSSGVDPRRIAIAGDSAGGGLAVAMLICIRDSGLPLPGCGWCISPWVDLEGIGQSMITQASIDPLIQKAALLDQAAAYLNGADPRSPLAAPIYADLRGLPPLLIQVGSAETLLDDATRLAGLAGAAGVQVTLEIWADMIHAWHWFHPRLAEGRQALSGAGAFIQSMLQGRGRGACQDADSLARR
jgi:epsilon-lactone hydrolase